MIEVMSAMVCQITGIDPIAQDQKCLGVDTKTGQIGFVENGGGAIGAMGSLIAMTYTPPIHSSDYFSYLAQNFGISKPVLAQSNGIGFSGLTPIRAIWFAFTKIVYLLFIIVFIIIGLAIMLRIKIDPRTVMSIENQIPKIIIGLLFITFSFAIAGFLIDVMYVLIFLIFNIFMDIFKDPSIAGPKIVEKIVGTQQTFNTDNVFGVFNNLVGFTDIVTNASGSVKDIVRNLFSLQQSNNGNIFLISGILDLGNALQNALALILGTIVGIAALLIIGIAVLFSMFRLWFTLIMSYINILLDIVLAPFWILTGVLPGGPGIGGWLRDILSNLIVFPATIVMFLFGLIFMEAFKTSTATANPMFTPPLIGNPVGNAFGPLIGLGFILMTPKIAEMAKAALKAPKVDLSAIGQAVGVGGSTAGGTGKEMAGSIASYYKGNPLTPDKKGFGSIMRRFQQKM